MENINVIFTLDGREIAIQCSKRDQMKSICQKFAFKVKTSLNSLMFLYAGNKVNFDLTLETQARSIDRKNNKMTILVYRKENEDELTCPKCGEKLNLNTQKIEELLSFNNDLVDSMSGIQDQLENVIKISTINKVNNQLKNIKTLINTIIEDIKKNSGKIQNLSNDIINQNFQNNNGILNQPPKQREKIIEYKYELSDKNPEIYTQTVYIEDKKDIKFEFGIVITSSIDFPDNGKTKFIKLNSKEKQPGYIIGSLKPGNNKNIVFMIPKKNLKFGVQKLDLILNIDGKNWGEPISLTFIVKSKKVDEFRREFNLDEKEYDDNTILSALQKYNFKKEDAFSSLFY